MDEIRIAGSKYLFYKKLNTPPQTYDFMNNGLLNKTMSKVIVNGKSVILKELLKMVETSINYICNYIDRLKNFKNYNSINR